MGDCEFLEKKQQKLQALEKDKKSVIKKSLSSEPKEVSEEEEVSKEKLAENLNQEEEKDWFLLFTEEEEKKEEEEDKLQASLSKSMVPLDKVKKVPDPEAEKKLLAETEIKLRQETIEKVLNEELNTLEAGDYLYNLILKMGPMEGRSESFREMVTAASELSRLMLLRKSQVTLDTEEYITIMIRLSQAAADYYHEHRGYVYTDKGKTAKSFAKAMMTFSHKLFLRVTDKKTEKDVQDTVGSGEGVKKHYTKNEIKIEKAKCEELAKMRKKWSKHIARNNTICTPEEKLKDRLAIFQAYEEQIRIYRSTTMPYDMPREVMLTIDEYEDTLRAYKAMEWANKNLSSSKEKSETPADLIQKHVEEEDERQHQEPFDKEKLDQGLTEEQLKGIAEIDQWLVRNFNNGGFLRFIPALRNRNGDFVSRILSLSKRERLHMYYLVETRARKDAMPLDTVISQTRYKPNLKTFRKMMCASRFKVTAHVTGSYVYMHKLSEAFQIMQNEETRAALQSAAHIAQTRNEDEKKYNTDRDADLRLYALAETNLALRDYKESLRALDSTKGKKNREAAEAVVKKKAAEVQKALKKLVERDTELTKLKERVDAGQPGMEKTDKAEREYNGRNSNIGATSLLVSAVSGISGKLTTGSKVLGIGWGLSNEGWNKFELWTGSIAGSLSFANNLMNGINNIYNLCTRGADMSVTDIMASVSGIAKNITDASRGALTVADSILKYVGYVNEAMKTPLASALQYTGIASALFQGAKAQMQWQDVYERSSELTTAQAYFNKKKQWEKGKKPQTEEERKEWRKNKFEQGMLKLSEKLKERDRNSAIYSSISAGISTLSVTIPGIGGSVAAAVGIAFNITASVLTSVWTTKAHTASFDHYFNMDEITDKVMQKMSEGRVKQKGGEDRNAIKKRLRRRVAAAAGFANMASAQDHVAKKYAEFVHNRLFGEDAVEGEELKAYVALVKSFGLPYDNKKKKPTIEALRRKMV